VSEGEGCGMRGSSVRKERRGLKVKLMANESPFGCELRRRRGEEGPEKEQA